MVDDLHPAIFQAYCTMSAAEELLEILQPADGTDGEESELKIDGFESFCLLQLAGEKGTKHSCPR